MRGNRQTSLTNQRPPCSQIIDLNKYNMKDNCPPQNHSWVFHPTGATPLKLQQTYFFLYGNCMLEDKPWCSCPFYSNISIIRIYGDGSATGQDWYTL